MGLFHRAPRSRFSADRLRPLRDYAADEFALSRGLPTAVLTRREMNRLIQIHTQDG